MLFSLTVQRSAGLAQQALAVAHESENKQARKAAVAHTEPAGVAQAIGRVREVTALERRQCRQEGGLPQRFIEPPARAPGRVDAFPMPDGLFMISLGKA